MSDLIAITYKEEDSALGALNELTQLQKEHVIELEDAAVATMNQKGKVKVKQTLESQHTGAVATWGFFWGFLVGLGNSGRRQSGADKYRQLQAVRSRQGLAGGERPAGEGRARHEHGTGETAHGDPPRCKRRGD